jgi:hypothetical protein
MASSDAPGAERPAPIKVANPAEWWSEPPPPPPQSPPPKFYPVSGDALRRRGAIDEHLENVFLPPRPSELVSKDDEALSFLDDEAFLDDDHKARKWTLNMLLPGLRTRHVPTCVVLTALLFIAFVGGFELNKHFGAAPGGGGGGGQGGAAGAAGGAASPSSGGGGQAGYAYSPPVDDRPFCGTEYAIAGGTAYGGHNEALGCVSVGRMTLAMCLATVEKRAQCTAATFKNQECWLHDRRQSVRC